MGTMDNTTPGRDIQAIMEASDYVQHGTFTMHGGSRSACICPKVPCGGVANDTEADGCPEHDLTPLRYQHWAAECPGPYARTVTPPQ